MIQHHCKTKLWNLLLLFGFYAVAAKSVLRSLGGFSVNSPSKITERFCRQSRYRQARCKPKWSIRRDSIDGLSVSRCSEDFSCHVGLCPRVVFDRTCEERAMRHQGNMDNSYFLLKSFPLDLDLRFVSSSLKKRVQQSWLSYPRIPRPLQNSSLHLFWLKTKVIILIHSQTYENQTFHLIYLQL